MKDDSSVLVSFKEAAGHGGSSHCSDFRKAEKGWEVLGLEELMALGKEAGLTAPSKGRYLPVWLFSVEW